MKRVRSIPEGFSVDIPGYNLLYNVSPFPLLRPIVVVSEVYDIEDNLVWIQLDTRHFGLFEKERLNTHRCPVCGQEWKHKEDD